MEREAGQGERDTKKLQAEVECVRKKAIRTGWNAEKEQGGGGDAKTKGRSNKLYAGGCLPSRSTRRFFVN